MTSGAKPIVAAVTPAENTTASSPAVLASAAPAPAAGGSAYTLQIMGSNHLSEVKSFMAAHNLDSTAQYYRTALNGKPWYMLTYGKYATEKQAIVALHQLPKSLDQYHPWVKNSSDG